MSEHPDMSEGPDPGIRNGVTVPYRVRFDECGPDGLVRSSALLRYVQDVAWVHSDQMGFDRAWYAARGLAWVVRAAELAILEPLALGQVVDVTTGVTGFRRVWARRRTEGRLPDGRLVLWGHTDWVMTDVIRGAPGRVPPEFPAAFDVPPGKFEPGRVPLPPTPEAAVRHLSRVRPQDLDPMGHVNNAAYLDYLEEALAIAGDEARLAITGTPRRIRLEYLAPAAPGVGLAGEAWPEVLEGGASWAWRLADDDGRELARARVLLHVA
jgi:acyl-CoA thioesterase FadM